MSKALRGEELPLSKALRDAALIAGFVAMAGYLGLARAVGDLYPFSTFSMYKGRSGSASRIGVLTADGALREVTDYVAWACDEGLALAESAPCEALGSFETIPYVDRQLVSWVRERPGGEAGHPVDLVRRVYHLGHEPGPPRSSDCVLARCRAVPR